MTGPDDDKVTLEVRRETLKVLRAALVAAAVAVTLATAILMLDSLLFSPTPGESVTEEMDQFREREQRLHRSIDSLDAQGAYLDSLLVLRDSIFRANPNALFDDFVVSTLSRVEVVSGRVDSLNRRLESLEDAISNNAEVALTIPMVRRDVEELGRAHDAEVLALERQLDRIIEQNRWMIGILFTLCVGLLGRLFGLRFVERKRPSQ